MSCRECIPKSSKASSSPYKRTESMLNWHTIYFFLDFALLFISFVASLSQRYRARVSYDGSGFQGFQLQRSGNRRTVQGCLEETIRRRFNLDHDVRVIAAGRTDSGVHARGQAVHMDLPVVVDDCAAVEYSLNQMLPADVRLWNLGRVPPPKPKTVTDRYGQQFTKEFVFDVMFDATRKLYSYRLSLAAVMDPLERRCRWHPNLQKGKAIDIDELRRLLGHLVGEHDFRAFAGSVGQLESRLGQTVSTTRRVYSAELVDEGSGNYRIDFLLKGALYKQVRNMVGTVLDVCQGRRLTEERFVTLLHQNATGVLTRSDNPSKPAPPEGLTLEHVFFDDENDTVF